MTNYVVALLLLLTTPNILLAADAGTNEHKAVSRVCQIVELMSFDIARQRDSGAEKKDSISYVFRKMNDSNLNAENKKEIRTILKKILDPISHVVYENKDLKPETVKMYAYFRCILARDQSFFNQKTDHQLVESALLCQNQNKDINTQIACYKSKVRIILDTVSTHKKAP
ncbi:MAG: hypothetical protein OEZ39_16390 [Gammaproteobacteria bacterium]|nr:hypothetical protein [Gammaproteobacteria bacterium]MDH5653439.1 hypothetical protein [Gammaproteobacteria bacterium]